MYVDGWVKLLTVCADDVWFDFCFSNALTAMCDNTIDSEPVTEHFSGLGPLSCLYTDGKARKTQPCNRLIDSVLVCSVCRVYPGKWKFVFP